jgi:hypothetical protein
MMQPRGGNLIRQPFSSMAANLLMQMHTVVVGAPIHAPPDDTVTTYFSALLSIANGVPTEYNNQPFSSIYLPVFDSFESNRTAVASMLSQIFWDKYFTDILPSTDNGIVIVLKSCEGSHTMEINGNSVDVIGPGDLHNRRFDSEMKKTSFQGVQSISDSTKQGLPLNKEFCPIELEVYPSMVRA